MILALLLGSCGEGIVTELRRSSADSGRRVFVTVKDKTNDNRVWIFQPRGRGWSNLENMWNLTGRFFLQLLETCARVPV